jgi:hypothetical protein
MTEKKQRGGEAMTQTALSFDAPIFPPNPYKPDTQKHRLYESLKSGPISNSHVVRDLGIFNSTGRLSEIREYLMLHGIHLNCRRIKDGLYEYSVSRPEDRIYPVRCDYCDWIGMSDDCLYGRCPNCTSRVRHDTSEG